MVTTDYVISRTNKKNGKKQYRAFGQTWSGSLQDDDIIKYGTSEQALRLLNRSAHDTELYTYSIEKRTITTETTPEIPDAVALLNKLNGVPQDIHRA